MSRVKGGQERSMKIVHLEGVPEVIIPVSHSEKESYLQIPAPGSHPVSAWTLSVMEELLLSNSVGPWAGGRNRYRWSWKQIHCNLFPFALVQPLRTMQNEFIPLATRAFPWHKHSQLFNCPSKTLPYTGWPSWGAHSFVNILLKSCVTSLPPPLNGNRNESI